MGWYRTPDGTAVHINFGRGKGPPPCKECGWIGQFQCDWKIGEGKTCDKYICEKHALQVADDKHLCPEHQAKYEAWKEKHGK